MTDFENAINIMKEMFGRDYQFALSTAKNNIPSSRYVDTYFDGESFYIVTYKLSQKSSEIAENPNVSLCCNKMHGFSGRATHIGHPLDSNNAAIQQGAVTFLGETAPCSFTLQIVDPFAYTVS